MIRWGEARKGVKSCLLAVTEDLLSEHSYFLPICFYQNNFVFFCCHLCRPLLILWKTNTAHKKTLCNRVWYFTKYNLKFWAKNIMFEGKMGRGGMRSRWGELIFTALGKKISFEIEEEGEKYNYLRKYITLRSVRTWIPRAGIKSKIPMKVVIWTKISK